MHQDEADDGSRGNRLASAEREELSTLRCEAHDLRRSIELLKAASAIFTRKLGQRLPRSAQVATVRVGAAGCVALGPDMRRVCAASDDASAEG